MRSPLAFILVGLVLLLGSANAFTNFTVLPGLFAGATPENDPFVFSAFGNIESGDTINGRIFQTSPTITGTWAGATALGSLISEITKTNAATDYINIQLSTINGFLPSNAAEGSVVYLERTDGSGPNEYSEVVAAGVITSYSIDAYASSFRIYFGISNPDPASLVFRYSNGVNQTAAQMGATCTATTPNANLFCGGFRQGNSVTKLAGCTGPSVPAVITCTRSTDPFNFLAPGPLEVDATAFGGLSWRQVQRIRPTIFPSTTIYRPAGGDISATFDGRALATYNTSDACGSTLVARNSIGLCSMDYLHLTSGPDFTGAIAGAGAQNWWDTARSPPGLFSNLAADSADNRDPPTSPGIISVGAKAIAGYTVFTGTSASPTFRIVRLALPSSASIVNGTFGLTQIGFVFPSVAENALAISASASTITIPDVRLGLGSGNGLELQWSNPSEAQNMTNCNYNGTALTCTVPASGIMRSGPTSIRYFITGRSYIPSYTSAASFVAVSHVVSTTAASVTDYPSASSVALTINGAGLRGVSTVITGTSVGSCASGFTAAANGNSLTCATYIPAAHAGTTILETTAANPTPTVISTTVLSTRPVITSSTTSVAADAGSVVINGRGFGNSSSPAPSVALAASSGGNSLPGATDFGDTFSISSRNAAGTQATISIGRRPRDGGRFAATYTINGVSSANTDVGAFTPVLTSTFDVIVADGSAYPDHTFTGWGLGPSPNVTFTTANAGSCAASGISGTFTTNGFSFSCSATGTEPLVANSYSATIGTSTFRTAATEIRRIRPSVTATATVVNATSTTFVVTGFGLGTPAVAPTVSSTFNLGVTCSPSARSGTGVASSGTMTCSVGASGFSTSGTLEISALSINGQNATLSPAVQVATIRPVFTAGSTVIDVTSATSSAFTVTGAGFLGGLSVTNLAIAGTPDGYTCANQQVNANGLSFTCTLNKAPQFAGILAGDITVAGVAAATTGNTLATYRPVLTLNTNNVLANATSLSFEGAGFTGTPTIEFSRGGFTAQPSLITCNPGLATATAFSCSIASAPTHSGSLNARVQINNVFSTWIQVATIIPVFSVTVGDRGIGSTTGPVSFSGNGLCGGVPSACTAPTVNIQPPFSFSCSVSSPTATSFTCSAQEAGRVGRVTATVSVGGVSSGVGDLFRVIPVVTSTATAVTASQSGNTISITTPNIGVATLASISVTFQTVGSATTPVCSSPTTSTSAVSCPNVLLSTSGDLSVTALSVVVGSETFAASIPTAIRVAVVTPSLIAPNPLPDCPFNNLGPSGVIVTVPGMGLANFASAADVSGISASLAQSSSSHPSGFNVSLYINAGTPIRTGIVAVTVTAGGRTSASVNFCTIRPSINAATPLLPSENGPTQPSAIPNSNWRFVVSGGPFTGTPTVSLTGSAAATCTLTNVTAITCTLTARPFDAGDIFANVTSGGSTSIGGAVAVARVLPVLEAIGNPTPTSGIAIDATSPTLSVTGWSLGPNFSFTVAPKSGSTFTCASYSAPTVLDATNRQRISCTIDNMPELSGRYAVSGYTAGSLSHPGGTSHPSVSGYLYDVAHFYPTIDSTFASTLWPVETSTFTVRGRGFTASTTLTPVGGATCTGTNFINSTHVECVSGTKPSVAGVLRATAATEGVNGVQTDAITVQPHISSITFDTSPFTYNINSALPRLNINGLALNAVPGLAFSSNNLVNCAQNARSATQVRYTGCSATLAGPISLSVFGITGAIPSNVVSVVGGTVAPVIEQTTTVVSANQQDFTITGHGLNCAPANRAISIANGGSCTLGTAPSGYTPFTSHTITCALSTTNRLQTFGPLRVTFTCSGVASASVQVGVVAPVVFPSPQISSFTYAFGAIPATTTWEGIALLPPVGTTLSSVIFLDAARGLSCSSATAAVVNTTAQQVTCTFTGNPSLSGPVSVVMGLSGARSSAVPVYYLAPSITAQSFVYGQSAPSISFNGAGFSAFDGSQVSIVIRTGPTQSEVATCNPVTPVGSGSSQSVTCTFSGGNRLVGDAFATVTSAGVASNQARVAVITADPVISGTQDSSILAVNAPRFTIRGNNFGTPAENRDLRVTLTLSSGVSPYFCDIESVADTVIVCGFRSSSTFPSGVNLIATVTRNDGPGVATSIYSLVPRPNITASIDGVSFNVSSLRIAGSNLGSSLDSLTVFLTLGNQNRTCIAGTGSNCRITGASGSTVDVVFDRFTVTPPYESLFARVIRAQGPTDLYQIRTLGYEPTVTASTDILSTLANQMVITGSNFYAPVPTRNIVILSSGQCDPIAATPTSITCNILGTPLPPGPLSVLTITSNGIRSTNPSVQVRTVLSVPVIFASTRGIQRGSSIFTTSTDPVVPANTLIIRGSGFSTTASALQVTLFPAGSPACNVVEAKSTYITCSTVSAVFDTLGPVSAVVTRGELSSGNPIQIGTVRDLPTITASNIVVSDVATSIVISGTGFSDYAAADNIVTFNQSGVACSPRGNTATSLTCNIVGRLSVGALAAKIQVDDLAQQSSDFVNVANVVLNPDIVSSLRSISPTTTVVRVSGQGFQTAAGSVTVTLSDSGLSCSVTVINATTLDCTLSAAQPAGTIISASRICAGTICNTFTTARPIATVRVVPSVAVSQVLTITTPPDLTLTIFGSGFSTVPSENRVTLSSGTCSVRSDPPPTANSLVCDVNPLEFRAGLFTAQVTVLDGVTSPQVPLYVFPPLFPALTSQRKVPIAADEIIIPAHYLTENTTEIVSVTLTRSNPPGTAAVCQVSGSSRTSVSCKLTTKFSRLGDFDVTLTMYATNATGHRVLFTTQPSVAGTVVPSVYDNELSINATQGVLQSIVIYGAGFFPAIAPPSVAVLAQAGKKRAIVEDITCVVVEYTSDNITCSLTVPTGTTAGDYFFTATVTDNLGVTDSYTSTPALLISINPSVTSATTSLGTELKEDGFVVEITGVGFSTIVSDNVITLVPAGLCDVFEATSTSIKCRVINGTVIPGPLRAMVGVRGVFFQDSVSLGIVDFDASTAPVADDGNNGPSTNGTAPVTDGAAPTTGGEVNVGPNSGTIAGIVIGIILGVAVVLLIIWVVVGYRKYGSVKEAFTGPFSGGAAAAYKGGRAPRKRAIFKARATLITPPYNEPVKASPGAGQGDDDVPPPPPPEDDDDAPPPPPEDSEDPPPPPEDEGTQFEMQRFGTLRVNPEEIFATTADDEDAPPPPEDSDSEEEAPPPPESSDSSSSESEDAPPPPEDDDPFSGPVGGDIDVDNIFD